MLRRRRIPLALGALLALGCGAEGTPAPRRPPNPTCHAPAQAVPAGLEGLPARLSQTGCFDSNHPAQPLPALLSYAVNAPLWSDGAEKDRWLALPDGARIALAPDGDFALPPGTVLIKTFRLEALPIETRFFVRHLDGAWSGYTYQWNEAGTDATLLDEGSHQRQVGDRTWHFPSRAECGKCHTAAAGYALGLELAQLERAGAAAGADQLTALARLGLLAAPLPAASARPAPLPDPGNLALPLPERARAYLHANCANCHRPGVGNSGTTDLRFTTPLEATASCGTEPLKGSLGYGADFRIIAPGDPDRSMLVVRMRELGSGRMPPIASLRPDSAGITLVSDWIRSLPGCP